jgi:integrase
VLSDDELRQLWGQFEALPTEMAAFYKLRLLTAQRGGEVATMRWADVDLEAGWWTIPATDAKNKLAHRVPLSLTACKLLAQLLQGARTDATYVIEGARGKRQQAEAAATFTVEELPRPRPPAHRGICDGVRWNRPTDDFKGAKSRRAQRDGCLRSALVRS